MTAPWEWESVSKVVRPLSFDGSDGGAVNAPKGVEGLGRLVLWRVEIVHAGRDRLTPKVVWFGVCNIASRQRHARKVKLFAPVTGVLL